MSPKAYQGKVADVSAGPAARGIDQKVSTFTAALRQSLRTVKLAATAHTFGARRTLVIAKTAVSRVA